MLQSYGYGYTSRSRHDHAAKDGAERVSLKLSAGTCK